MIQLSTSLPSPVVLSCSTARTTVPAVTTSTEITATVVTAVGSIPSIGSVVSGSTVGRFTISMPVPSVGFTPSTILSSVMPVVTKLSSSLSSPVIRSPSTSSVPSSSPPAKF